MDVSSGKQNLSLFSLPGETPAASAPLQGGVGVEIPGIGAAPTPAQTSFQQQLEGLAPTAAPVSADPMLGVLETPTLNGSPVVAQAPHEGDFAHALQDSLLEGAKKKKGLLDMLAQLVGTGADVIQKSKPLAFLHNQLAEIPVKDIPNLVASNPFITQALSMGVQDFMESPQSLGALLDMLQLPKPALGDTGMTLPLQEKITPKAFLKGLGIDPHVVAAALAALESKLPQEGVQPYMQEASRQQSNAQDKSAAPVSGEPSTSTPRISRAAARAARAASPSPEDALKAEDLLAQAASQANMGKVAGASTPKGASADLSTLPSNRAMSLADTTSTSQPPASMTSPIPLQARRVDFDPFAESTGLSFSGTTPDTSKLQPALGETKVSLDSWIASMPAQREGVGSQPVTGFDARGLLSTQEGSVDSAAMPLSKNASVTQLVSTETTPALALSQALATEKKLGEEKEEKSGSKSHLSETTILADHAVSHTAPFSLSKTEATVHPNTQATYDTIAEKVLERSEIMLPAKHNSAVIDVKSAEGESIRLAVKIEDSKVEMRITSASDKVLTNLARDVDHLHNALADRKLHLADIKFSKENPHSQNSAFMQFQDRNTTQQGPRFDVDEWKQGTKPFAPLSAATNLRGWSRSNFIPAPTATSGQRVQVLI